jgi:site-specific recombinase XerD
MAERACPAEPALLQGIPHKGESLPIVGKLLGHTQPQTTARYAHLADSPLREAANRFPDIQSGSRMVQ